MDVVSLKEYIYKNDKIEFVLSEIGCKRIQYHENKEYYSCTNYNGDNPSAVNVRNNKYLNVKNWTREKEFGNKSDLITLVEYNKKMSFYAAVKYLHKILGLNYKYKKPIKKKKKDNDNYFNCLARYHNTVYCDVTKEKVLDEDILNDYTPVLYIGWLREGIMPWTAKRFGLAYSFRRNRIIIPHRNWFTGELIGINARTTVENYEEFGIKKYWITPSYKKSLNIYGLYENRKYIEEAGYVVV